MSVLSFILKRLTIGDSVINDGKVFQILEAYDNYQMNAY